MLSKRISLMCLVAVLVVGLIATIGVGQLKAEYWNRIPSEMKVRIITYDYAGDREFAVMCFSFTDTAFGLLLNDPVKASSLVSGLKAIKPEGDFLMLSVGAYQDGAYWFPTEIVFTQGNSQHSVGYNDIVEISEPFSGGRFLGDTIASGLLLIPSKIDLMEPFKVWVGEEFGGIESFHGNPKQ